MRLAFPRSLPSWFLIILVTGLLVTQISTLWIASQDRADANNALELFRLSERTMSLVKLFDATPAGDWNNLALRLSDSGQNVTITPQPVVATALASADDLAELEDVLVARLARFHVIDARIRRDSVVRRRSRPVAPFDRDYSDIGAVERQIDNVANTLGPGRSLTASLQFSDGRWLNFSIDISPMNPIITSQTIPLFALVALVVIVGAIAATRGLTAPYRVLEKGVERIGSDLKSPPLPETGIREYAAAARAVNTMQARLQDYIAERDQLAAALAHDLRTPLTRMRLRLALLDDDAIARALSVDLDNIEAISSSVIDFATFELIDEPREKVDLWSMLLSITDDYPDVALEENIDPRGTVVLCQPVSVRRCITNLIDNAFAYGKNAAISLRREGDMLVLRVKDDGPGIAPDQIEEMFRPFNRAEKSRNRASGGFGLGLTIARSVARANGGDIRLENAPEGGLIAEMRLPAVASKQPDG
ncbi:MAG: ATP-binding protein [Rhizobiales bacterium]|nr:ATP-binding protein [Hyphomicrobiales bacterium]OJX98614.1 MAG: osmolarity sensor protein EnvZ [Rhizobiales bacterium 63-22]